MYIQTFSYRRSRRDRAVVRFTIFLLLAVFVSSVILALSVPVRAEESQHSHDGQHSYDGLYLRQMEVPDAAFVEAPRLAQTIKLDIAAVVARGKVTQLFRNDSLHWVEGRYRFPLPDGAAVDTLRIRVNDRLVEGEIREREEARKEYDAAKSAGKTAALLNEERPNLFTLSLANIGPGETIAVDLEFQSTVRREGDLFEFRMPLVVAPRYMPELNVATIDHPAVRAEIARRLEEAERLGFPIDLSRKANPTALEIDLDAGAELATLESPSHELVVSRVGEKYRVGLSMDEEPADRDMILRWRTVRGEEPGAILFHEKIGDTDYLLAMVQPPDRKTAQSIAKPRDVTFVIDTSGSMTGVSMEGARLALIEAITALTAQDSFDVIEFDNEFSRLFGQSVAASEQAVGRAIRFALALQADGGTEMEWPLRSALAQPTSSQSLRQIVFLTDGQVGNEDDLFQMIEANLGKARLFTVSLGTAPNGWFMRKAAELGAGETLAIANEAEASSKMAEFYRNIQTPVATDLELTTAHGGTAELYPPRLPDLYGQRALLVPLAIQDWDGHLTLTGELAGEDWTVELDRSHLHTAKGIAKLWAEAKVGSLMDDMRRGVLDEETGRLAVVAVAIPHRLATRYTSFVAVDKEIRRPADAPLEQADIANNAPAGMAMASLTGPAGAAGWQSMALIGIGFIAGSLILLLVSRRWQNGEEI